MSLSVSDLLLRVSSEGIDAERRELSELARSLAEVDGETADAEVKVDTADALLKLDRFRERLGAVDRERVSPEVNMRIADALAKIGVLEAALKKVDGTKEINVKLRRSLISQLGQIERTVGGVTRDIEGTAAGAASVLERVGGVAAGVLAGIASGIGSLLSQLPLVGGLLAKPFEGLAAAGEASAAALGPLALVIVPLLLVGLAQLASIVVALGGALFALGASLAAAAAGFGAIAVAAAAAFGPVLLVGIALFTRLAAVIKAVHDREQERAQAQAQVKAAHDQVASAADQVRQAEQNLRDQTVAGFQAMQAAADAYKHDLLSIDEARLGVKDARLELRQANAELAKFRKANDLAGSGFDSLFKKSKDIAFDPAAMRALIPKVGGKSLDSNSELELEQLLLRRQHALLGIREANQRVSDSEKQLAQDQKTNADFAERGLRAYKPYRDAVDRLRRAKLDEAKASDQLARAQAKLNAPLKGLTANEQKFAGVIEQVGQALKKAFGPAVSAALAGVTTFLHALVDVLTDPRIQASLTAIGGAIGQFFAALGRKVDTREWKASFADFAGAAARMMGSARKAFLAVLDIVRQITAAALPSLESGSRKVAGWLERVAADHSRIRRATQSVVSQFKTWLGVASAVSRLVLAFLRAAAPAGQKLANKIRDWANHQARILNSKGGQDRLKRFFDACVKKVTSVWEGLKKWLPELKKILDFAVKIINAFDKAASFIANNPIAKFVGTADQDHVSVANDQTVNKAFDAVRDGSASTPSRIRTGLSLLELRLNPVIRKEMEKLLRQLGFRGRFPEAHDSGGPVGGVGGPDTTLSWLTPGEFVVRKAIVRSIGLPKLKALNAGIPLPALAGAGVAGGDRIVHEHYHIPQAPAAHGQPDPVVTAQQLRRLMRRRGQ